MGTALERSRLAREEQTRGRPPVVPPPPECLLHGTCRPDGACSACEGEERRSLLVLVGAGVALVAFYVWLFVRAL